MDQLQGTLSEGQQRLARDLRVVIQDAEALLGHAVRDAGAGYDETRARLQKSIEAARGRLAGMERAAAERLGEAGRAADGYVHEHPWTAIGAGAGVGLLVGLLLGRR